MEANIMPRRQNKETRPQNREVEDEMIRPPESESEPPRPATEPHEGHEKNDHSQYDNRPEPPGNIHERGR